MEDDEEEKLQQQKKITTYIRIYFFSVTFPDGFIIVKRGLHLQ